MQEKRAREQMTMGFVRNMINRRDMLEKQGYNRKTAAEQVKREALAALQLRKDKEAQEKVRLGEREEEHDWELTKEQRKYKQAFDILGEQARIKQEDAAKVKPLSSTEKLNLTKYTNESLDYITNPEIDWNSRVSRANIENNRPGAGVVYEMVSEGEEPWLGKNTEDVINVHPIPPGMKINGSPPTGNEIIRRAKMANMSIEEFLNKIQQR